MFVKQLSIFLENKEGRLLKTLDIIEKLNINIRALSIADTSEFGILRLIVKDPELVKVELEKNDFIVKLTDVIAVSMEDNPGGLNKILRVIEDNKINLEYLYAFAEQKKDRAIVLLRFEQMDYAIEVLQKNDAPIISPDEVYTL